MDVEGNTELRAEYESIMPALLLAYLLTSLVCLTEYYDVLALNMQESSSGYSVPAD